MRDRIFFFQAEDGIRDFCLSRGLGDVYKRQFIYDKSLNNVRFIQLKSTTLSTFLSIIMQGCLLYTSDAADEEDSVDLGGRRII
ncbi:hypothetical protein CDFC105_93853 [Clostridioides difficile]|nr:hypothetical protein CDFC105_93853 [Clostridioides difficile]